MHLRGIRALAAASGANMNINVMCTLGGAQATEKAAQLWFFLMCRLRSGAVCMNSGYLPQSRLSSIHRLGGKYRCALSAFRTLRSA